ncbi:MAG: YceI family protein [Flavobacteriaceae bacterium]|jgi:hypothetical protein|nr:YceI family protein [Flavobacteriaceae bacterium]MDG2314856.1 YceI family protein [Flavobacteriaceae bacterium]
MSIRNKGIAFFFGLLFCNLSIAQTKYITRSGVLGFESSMASFEPVIAENKDVTAVLDTNNGNIAILALVRGFRFPNALMEEHFNENYAETDRFPKATFSGTILDYENIHSQKQCVISGALSFHGVTQSFQNIVAHIEINPNSIRLKGTFLGTVADFDIQIPKLVRNKISKDIEISFDLLLKNL